jgi:hypothetical protein
VRLGKALKAVFDTAPTGLAISRQLAEDLGARLEFPSNPARGGVFRPDLVIRTHRRAAARRSDSTRSCSGVVVDDRPNREVAQDVLNRLGQKVDVAGNGGETLAVLIYALAGHGRP